MIKPILLAEDLEPDAILIQTALKKAGVTNPVIVVTDGDQAVAYLKGEGIFDDRKQFPLPAMLLLDLKMPRANGLQVLEWCKSQPALRELVIVVMSGYNDLWNINRAYELGAATFLTKPIRQADLTNLIGTFKKYLDA